MPIRRSVASSQETSRRAPAQKEEKTDADVSSEESASTGEEQENETPAAPATDAGKPKDGEEEKKKSDAESVPEGKKDEKDETKEKDKQKKIKKTIPSWATLSANQLARAQKHTQLASSARPKMDAILTEAIKACFHRSGASVVAIRKYIIKKYPSLDLERRGYILKQALKRELQRGAIKQVKGKGASGSFVMAANAGKQAQKSQKSKGARKRKGPASGQDQPEKLENILPLVFTRLCEPKEASYSLIKKYVAQHYPKLNVDAKPQMLKNALQRAVDKGQLEQITGKGASGTFQLKRSGDKHLLSGGPYEDAILAAVTAMNEPKTCSTTLLKKYVLEKYPTSNNNFQVHLLKRTLHKCEKNGWMEQITGKGFSGTYMLCFPYYPSPDVLFPEKHKDESEDESEDEDEEDESEEESEEESESEDDEPPKKKSKQQKRPAPRARARATPQKRKETKPKPSKVVPAKKGRATSAPKKAKTAPAKAAPTSKKSKPAPPPPPAAKKAEIETPKKPAPSGKKETKSPAKGKPNARKSQRAKK